MEKFLSSPYFTRKNKDIIGSAGRRSEKAVVKRLGGRPTPASGATNSGKGDVKVEEFLIEAKSTVKASMSIERVWLEKISMQAAMTNRYPALSVTFARDNGSPLKDGAWVMVPENVWRRLCQGS
jgi:hypothetical protein